MVFIIIGGICAVVSLITAVLTLRAEIRRIQAEKLRIHDEIKRVTQSPTARVTTKSESIVQIHEFNASVLQRT